MLTLELNLWWLPSHMQESHGLPADPTREFRYHAHVTQYPGTDLSRTNHCACCSRSTAVLGTSMRGYRVALGARMHFQAEFGSSGRQASLECPRCSHSQSGARQPELLIRRSKQQQSPGEVLSCIQPKPRQILASCGNPYRTLGGNKKPCVFPRLRLRLTPKAGTKVGAV